MRRVASGPPPLSRREVSPPPAADARVLAARGERLGRGVTKKHDAIGSVVIVDLRLRRRSPRGPPSPDRLADGALWVHSPVALDAALRAALDALGPVRFVVTPNAEHMKWAADWIRAYPDATSYACPNLAAARPDVGFDEVLGAVNAGGAPRAWGGEFDACYVDAERNPFTGKPFFNEVLHKTRTTDRSEIRIELIACN